MICSNFHKSCSSLVLTLLAFASISCATASRELNSSEKNEFQSLFDPNTTYQYFREPDSFVPKSRKPNIVNMAWLADAAMLAYCKPEFVEAQFKNAGFKNSFDSISSQGTQAFIASSGEAIFVIFRGTEVNEPQDLLYDANFLPTAEGGGQTHKGFKDALEAVWPALQRKLNEKTETGNHSVWFTGHSLGGAIASLAAARWKTGHDGQTVSLYTFGAPGVGNEDYVRKYPKVTVVRVINNEDTVPKVENIALRHPGGMTVRFMRPSEMMLIKKEHKKLGDWLADHAPIYYANNSWRQVEEKVN